jgi:hypothetical protein
MKPSYEHKKLSTESDHVHHCLSCSPRSPGLAKEKNCASHLKSALVVGCLWALLGSGRTVHPPGVRQILQCRLGMCYAYLRKRPQSVVSRLNDQDSKTAISQDIKTKQKSQQSKKTKTHRQGISPAKVVKATVKRPKTPCRKINQIVLEYQVGE